MVRIIISMLMAIALILSISVSGWALGTDETQDPILTRQSGEYSDECDDGGDGTDSDRRIGDRGEVGGES